MTEPQRLPEDSLKDCMPWSSSSGESVFERTAAIRADSISEETRSVDVSFSSQGAVQDRWWGPPRVLLHELRAVDMSVMRSMGSALLNHNPDVIVGRAASLKIDEEDRKGRATIHFDDDEDGERAWNKVKSGSLRGVSVRFSVEKSQVLEERAEWKSPGGQTFRGGDVGLEVATRWTPREISLTPIPADVSVGVGRGATQKENTPMFSDKTIERLTAHGLEASNFVTEESAIAVLDQLDKQDAERAAATVTGNTFDPSSSIGQAMAAAIPTAPPPPPTGDTQVEPTRAELASTFKAFSELSIRAGKPELLSAWIDRKATVEDAQREVIELLAARSPTPMEAGRVDVGRDTMDKTLDHVNVGLSRRMGLQVDEVSAENQKDCPDYMSIPAAARMFLRAANVPQSDFLSDYDVITRAMNLRRSTGRFETFQRAHSGVHLTGDFPLLFANLANKGVLNGAAEAGTTYDIVSTKKQLRDFRTHTFVQAGEIEDLELTPDSMQFPAATMSEKSQGMALFSYSRKIGFGRQALINDDVSALTDMSRRLGQASARTRNSIFWAHVYSASGVGPSLTEGGSSVALFATTHASGSNYYVHANATLQDASLAEGRKLMRLQSALTKSDESDRTTPSTAKHNLTPRFLIVPATLEHTADQIVNGIYTPATSATSLVSSNRSLQIVVEALLDGATNGATAWYLWADPTLIDTVAFATLAGSSGPMFKSWQENDGLGFWFAVVDDFGVQALEHRGVFRSKGAA